jgi:TonB family protein
MSKWLRVHVCLCVAALMPLTALADLYSADEAYRKQEFARSFDLYRELAELGRHEAQENLAVMYVNGEGVKRDNVLGYAWAVIAQENGGSAAMQNIVTQLEPHMTAAARTRVAEVRAQFGLAALQERLFPAPDTPESPPPSNVCKIRKPANPDDYFPKELVFTASGSVDLEVDVAPDGRVRNAKVLYSLPPKMFDEAGQRVALDSGFTTPTVNGRAIACRTRFRVNFADSGITTAGGDAGTPEQKKEWAKIRAKAEGGDPRSQLEYGVILDTRSGVNVGDESASDWFLKAAQAGIPTAQYLLGRRMLVSSTPATQNEVDKGLFWLRRAADGRQSDAQAALANYLLRTDPGAESLGKAHQLLEKSAAAGNRDGKYNLAALLATAPDAAHRDPQRALALLEEVREFKLYPVAFEIRAAAQAMLGDFAGAQANQTKALKMAKKLSWDTQGQEARLASYAASKSWTGDLFAY